MLVHYGLDASWETQLLAGLSGDAAPRLLVIDDLADLLLDQNFFVAATETRYAGLVPEHCRQRLGVPLRVAGYGIPQGRLKVCPGSPWRGCQHWVRSAGLSALNASKLLCRSRSAHTG